MAPAAGQAPGGPGFDPSVAAVGARPVVVCGVAPDNDIGAGRPEPVEFVAPRAAPVQVAN